MPTEQIRDNQLMLTHDEVNLLRQLIEHEQRTLEREKWLDDSERHERMAIVLSLKKEVLKCWSISMDRIFNKIGVKDIANG